MSYIFSGNTYGDRNIFQNQRVSRRKRPPLYGPDRTRNFIDTIKQYPAKPVHPRKFRKPENTPVFTRTKRFTQTREAAPLEQPRQFTQPGQPPRQETRPRKTRAPRSHRRLRLPRLRIRSLSPFFKPGPAPVRQEAPRPSPRAARKRSPFKFPLVPVVIITIVAAFSALCLSWQGNPFALERSAALPDPVEDFHYQESMSAYAGVNLVQTIPEQVPLEMTKTFAWKSYRVKKGDSVSRIAADFALSMDSIISSNGIDNVRRLREGELLKIPNMNGISYTVKKGDSLTKIASGMGVPLEAVLDANDMDNDAIREGTVLFIPGARMRTEDLKIALGELFVYPIQIRRITSTYGWRPDPFTGVRLFHTGLDLAAPLGTPVKAAMDGTVAFTGINAVYGKYIILSHAGGYETLYAHLSQISVSEGTRVIHGTKVGEVGSTGKSTGYHLHFGIFKNGRSLNPLDYLNPQGIK